ncbi:MAG: hypothetical protein JNL90_00175 [Planctomycetes bacterium]|nr:hypothetical protein [Planctomycetota bacterium]
MHRMPLARRRALAPFAVVATGLITGLITGGTTDLAAAAPRPARAEELGIDPITLLQWQEACRLVDAHEAEIWPGYRLSEIPALMSHPGKAEVLLRFPRPPPSYVRFTGKNPLGADPATAEPLFVRRGTTLYSVVTDTTANINGVQTLVVTDRGARDSIDDAWNLCTQVHEGFHAWASRAMKLPAYNELDLADYPDLEPERAARLELEGEALLAALAAESPDEREEQALRFLGLRERRRAGLAPAILRAEDANEMNEGLATYVEWRALELWRDHGVGAALAAGQPGFDAARECKEEVEQRTTQLRHLARHTMAVNGDSFGTAVVRRRGYFFGGALGRLLDPLAPDWKGRVVQGVTLTELLHDALGAPAADELAAEADAAEDEANFAALVARKETQAAPAAAAVARRVATVLEGAGTLLRIDLSALTMAPLLPTSYTPFGVLRVAPGQRLFHMAPTAFDLGTASVHTLSGDVAVIADDERKELLIRTPLDSDAVLAALTRPSQPGVPSYADAALRIEGVIQATTVEADGSIVVRMAPAR